LTSSSSINLVLKKTTLYGGNLMISKRVLVIALALVAVTASVSLGVDTIGSTSVNHFWNGGLVDLGSYAITKIDTSTDQGTTVITPPYEGMRQQVAAGFNGFDWAGTAGVTNSAAKNSVTTLGGLGPLYGLGIQTADEYVNFFGYSQFHGIDVTAPAAANWALTTFTYMGDADLSGTLTLDDYFYIDTSRDTINAGGTVPGTWANGDFDMSGTITLDDYYFIDTVRDYINAGGATPPINIQTAGAAAAAVPEPSTVVLALLALGCFFGFRKIRK
jgi:hypothetical protein